MGLWTPACFLESLVSFGPETGCTEKWLLGPGMHPLADCPSLIAALAGTTSCPGRMEAAEGRAGAPRELLGAVQFPERRPGCPDPSQHPLSSSSGSCGS